MTFSGGLIDLVLFGVMQGNAKTHWVWVVVVGAVYFVLYYIIFRFMISKFDRTVLPRWVHWCWLPATQAPLFTACWSVR